MHALDALRQGLADGTHIGGQLHVSHAGVVIADVAVGYARDGVDMTTDSMMTWFSMTKAVTSVAVAQQWERGAFDIDDPVTRYVPEFGVHGKDRITIRHLLTHTAGIPNADGILDERRGASRARRTSPAFMPHRSSTCPAAVPATTRPRA